MPIETVNITTTTLSLDYYLIAYDANGNERLEPTGFMSQKLLDILATQPITDVFFRTYATGTNSRRGVAVAHDNLNQTKHIGILGHFSC
ncbi:hypothetical protein IQ244_24700 [Nostoc sp. LEGE 06077]|uniref:hypothetical protein n=1 Tax=Nostoc sp. LEGE 06077 TaxID=915325 RepID=UPI0018816180|nr:hypothetical protein [Nostoc sp. LEGE 06077]MBE9209638.1 hypothetical protein [Nostoc sp. LEGE 06077]